MSDGHVYFRGRNVLHAIDVLNATNLIPEVLMPMTPVAFTNLA